MTKFRRYVRKQLLELIEEEKVYEFSARFLAKKNEAWLTISQLTLRENKGVLASHINLPVHKLDIDHKELNTLVKGQLLFVKAKVSSYKSAGATRGTLIGFGPKDKIEICAEINSIKQ